MDYGHLSNHGYQFIFFFNTLDCLNCKYFFFVIGVISTNNMVGSGFFEAVIIGKGGHAAIPQHTMDPILAASNVIVSLQHGDKPHSISECSGVFNLGVSGVLR